ncbi:unnamed protein product [Linum trigynum]|uniref:Uncharacterized protein n=1 Tax=Linum trigynum TaxID=586398 RepID=A0AAV2ER90_9ROSI
MSLIGGISLDLAATVDFLSPSLQGDDLETDLRRIPGLKTIHHRRAFADSSAKPQPEKREERADADGFIERRVGYLIVDEAILVDAGEEMVSEVISMGEEGHVRGGV